MVSGEVLEERDRFLEDLLDDDEEAEKGDGGDDAGERTIGAEGCFEVEAEAREAFDGTKELLRL